MTAAVEPVAMSAEVVGVVCPDRGSQTPLVGTKSRCPAKVIVVPDAVLTVPWTATLVPARAPVKVPPVMLP